jgi:type I restriction enzyme S subunit
MKAGWVTKRLGEVCDFRGGGTPSKAVERYWQGDIPWVSPKDMKFDVVSDSIDHVSVEAIEGSATSLIPKDSVLIVVRSGILARIVPIALTGCELTINQDLKALCPKKGIDARFLYYLLEGKMDVLLASVSRGATVHRLTTDLIRSVDFLLPPLPEQQRIVAILDEAFDGIATAKANAEKNLQNAHALFENHLRSVFIQHGDGWLEKRLGDVCHKITDGTHATPTYTKSGVPFLSVKDLTKGFIDFSDTRFISVEEHQALTRRCKPVKNDILYTKVGTTGVAQVVDVDEEFSIFVSVALLKINHEIIYNSYLEHFLNAPYAREQAQQRTRGMANKNLVITDIKEIVVDFPRSLEQQRSLVTEIDTLRAETQRLESIYRQKLAALVALKKSLLDQAFTGLL